MTNLEYRLSTVDPTTRARITPMRWTRARGTFGILGFIRSIRESVNCQANPLQSVTRRPGGCTTLVFARGQEETLCFRRSGRIRS